MEQQSKAALYLRTGSRVQPGIMTLNEGRLSFRTADALIFDTDIEQCSAVFTLFSTLVLTTNGATYTFVTGSYAGALATDFTKEQLAELTDSNSNPGLVKRFKKGALVYISNDVLTSAMAFIGSSLGRGLGILGQAAGVVILFRAHRESFYSSKAWVLYLKDKGLDVVMKGTTFARSQLVIASIGIPLFIAFVAVVFWLVSSLS